MKVTELQSDEEVRSTNCLFFSFLSINLHELYQISVYVQIKTMLSSLMTFSAIRFPPSFKFLWCFPYLKCSILMRLITNYPLYTTFFFCVSLVLPCIHIFLFFFRIERDKSWNISIYWIDIHMPFVFVISVIKWPTIRQRNHSCNYYFNCCENTTMICSNTDKMGASCRRYNKDSILKHFLNSNTKKSKTSFLLLQSDILLYF